MASLLVAVLVTGASGTRAVDETAGGAKDSAMAAAGQPSASALVGTELPNSAASNDLAGLTEPLTYTDGQPSKRLTCFWAPVVRGGKWTGGDKRICP